MEHYAKLKTTETLITKLSSVSDQTRLSALCEIRLLTKLDPETRPIITTHNQGQAISLLAETLYSPSPSAQENATATLLNISISCKEPLILARAVLDSLAHILSNHRTGTPQAVQNVAALIYSFTVEESYRGFIGGKRDIVYALIDIVGWKDSPTRSVKDGLKALFGLALTGSNRPLMVRFGAVEALFRVVVNDGRCGLVEDSTAVLAQIAGCEESVNVFRKCCGVRVLVECLGRETGWSWRVKENAVSGLLSLVKVGGDVVGEEIREVGLGLVFDGLGEVVDSGSDKGKKRAQSLINILEDGMRMSMSFKEDDYSGSDLYPGPESDSSNSYSF